MIIKIFVSNLLSEFGFVKWLVDVRCISGSPIPTLRNNLLYVSVVTKYSP